MEHTSTSVGGAVRRGLRMVAAAIKMTDDAVQSRQDSAWKRILNQKQGATPPPSFTANLNPSDCSNKNAQPAQQCAKQPQQQRSKMAMMPTPNQQASVAQPLAGSAALHQARSKESTLFPASIKTRSNKFVNQHALEELSRPTTAVFSSSTGMTVSASAQKSPPSQLISTPDKVVSQLRRVRSTDSSVLKPIPSVNHPPVPPPTSSHLGKKTTPTPAGVHTGGRQVRCQDPGPFIPDQATHRGSVLSTSRTGTGGSLAAALLQRRQDRSAGGTSIVKRSRGDDGSEVHFVKNGIAPSSTASRKRDRSSAMSNSNDNTEVHTVAAVQEPSSITAASMRPTGNDYGELVILPPPSSHLGSSSHLMSAAAPIETVVEGRKTTAHKTVCADTTMTHDHYQSHQESKHAQYTALRAAANRIKSINEAAGIQAVREEGKKRLAALESEDLLYEAQRTVTQIEVDAFWCSTCRRYYSSYNTGRGEQQDSSPSGGYISNRACVVNKHKYRAVRTKRRFFDCDNCRYKLAHLGDLSPYDVPCPKCGHEQWREGTQAQLPSTLASMVGVSDAEIGGGGCGGGTSFYVASPEVDVE